MDNIRCLSIRQPWAHLILEREKAIEVRTWNTRMRGRFLIHAGMKPEKGMVDYFGLDGNLLQTGMILGSAVLDSVKRYDTERQFMKDKHLHRLETKKDQSYPIYGFILKDPLRLEDPIPAKGKLGFFRYDHVLPSSG